MSKVAFFYATFPRPTETFIRRELRALGKIGFEPDIYSIWRGDLEWEQKQINRFHLSKLFGLLFWLPYWILKKPFVFREVLKHLWDSPCPNLQNWSETFLGLGFALVQAHAIKQKKYTLFHGVWATMPATAAYALSKLTDVPFSMGAHAYDVFRTGGDWLLGLKITSASFIRTSSLSSAKRIKELGVSEDRIRLIRRGLAHWPNRKRFELVNDEHLEILSVGRMVEKKGYLNQLSIAKKLKKLSIPFRLKIVGGGPLLEEMKRERNRLGLIEQVKFLGSQKQIEIRELYLNSDVFLFTGIIARNGDRDGIPNVIPEAMSAGCLIISTNIAGASEAFIEDVSGFSIRPSRTHDWVDLIIEFFNRPDSFVQIRKTAVKHANQTFNISRTANLLAEAIERAINE